MLFSDYLLFAEQVKLTICALSDLQDLCCNYSQWSFACVFLQEHKIGQLQNFVSYVSFLRLFFTFLVFEVSSLSDSQSFLAGLLCPCGLCAVLEKFTTFPIVVRRCV